MIKRNKILLWLSVGIMLLYILSFIVGMTEYGMKNEGFQQLIHIIVFISVIALPVVGLITQNMYIVNTEKDKKIKRMLLIGVILTFVVAHFIGIFMLNFVVGGWEETEILSEEMY